MGDPLPIADQKIRSRPQPTERFYERRSLSETEKTGNVWEPDPGFHAPDLDRFEVGVGKDEYSGEHQVAPRVIGDIGSRHMPDPEPPLRRAQSPPQVDLHGDCPVCIPGPTQGSAGG